MSDPQPTPLPATAEPGCFLTPEEIKTLSRCKTCGGIYGAECPPHRVAEPGQPRADEAAQ